MPLVLLGFHCASNRSHRLALYILIVSSYVFYAYWVFWYVGILIFSVAVNMAIAARIDASVARGDGNGRRWLIGGISFNLLLIGFFKYADMLITVANDVLGANWSLLRIEVPPGISFYTFTQIAYLVDVKNRSVRPYDGVRYSLFVAYFPHLMSGPLLQHNEIMPQLESRTSLKLDATNVCVGIIALTCGLAKKLFIADYMATFCEPTFAKADALTGFGLCEAIFAALAYSLQIYYDFSGYSDMAVGISIMFGIALPLNFAMPYRATSFIEFWRNWHISLSRFIRDYVYIPLGGGRDGRLRKYKNIMVAMTLCGLWHGANYTFVVWGMLHGLLLVANHHFRTLPLSLNLQKSWIFKSASWLTVFVSVSLLWIVFRAGSLGAVAHYYKCLLGLSGLSALDNVSMFTQRIYMFIIFLVGATIVPDTYRLLAGHKAYLAETGREDDENVTSRWRISLVSPVAIACGVLFIACTVNIFLQSKQSPFLYFQF